LDSNAPLTSPLHCCNDEIGIDLQRRGAELQGSNSAGRGGELVVSEDFMPVLQFGDLVGACMRA